MKTKLYIGAGRAVITPPLGTILYGYAPGRSAESVNDDLTITCIAARSENITILLLSATLCLLSDSVSLRIRELVSEATDIPVANVILSATHTHSGPNTVSTSGWGAIDNEYIDKFVKPGAVKAAKDAANSLCPAKLGIGTTQSDVGVNRRQFDRDGNIFLGQCPWGIYDPQMTVLSFKGEDGKIIVNLIHYCAHGTGSGCNPEVTRDWSGPMIDRLEEQTGGMTVFFNGAEGDIAPRVSNGNSAGNLKLALELGGKASIDAVRAWHSITDWSNAMVGVINEDIKLPYDPLPSEETAKAEIERIGDIDKLPVNQHKYELINELQRWNSILAEYSSSKILKTDLVLNQSIVYIGPVAFVPFPFEVFVEITLRIRAFSPYPYTLCLSNTNGSYSYFPSQDQICRGGYEVWMFKCANAYKLRDDADNYSVTENLRMLDKLYDME
jgi:neutral ceramidase